MKPGKGWPPQTEKEVILDSVEPGFEFLVCGRKGPDLKVDLG